MIVVEIDNTWLVLGVAPGRVNKLHIMNKPLTDAASTTPDNPPVETFATQLNQSIKKKMHNRFVSIIHSCFQCILICHRLRVDFVVA